MRARIWWPLSKVSPVRSVFARRMILNAVLVSVPEAEESDPEPWFIFNDFAVQNITESEALSIPSGWKVSYNLPATNFTVMPC